MLKEKTSILRLVLASVLMIALAIVAVAPAARARNVARQHVHRTAFTRRYRYSLSERVDSVLRTDHRFNGAHAYAVPGATIVLWGTVFDDQDSRLAADTASHVRGVSNVENHLTTTTGQWMAQQVLINNALVQVGALQNVSARVIGNQAYLWGEVNSESDKTRAARVASSFANLQVVNLVRVVPGPLFSLPSWL